MRLTRAAIVSVALAAIGLLSSVAMVLCKTAGVRGYASLLLVLAASSYVASIAVACRYGWQEPDE